MKSIKTKLIQKFLIVLLLLLIILDVVLTLFIKNYYYDNTKSLLKSQMQVATSYYSKYFKSYSLEENIYDNVDIFGNQTEAQVQIYDSNGELLMDSIGVLDDNVTHSDVDMVINGEESASWTGKVSYFNNEIMAVSMPIINGDIKVGVIRYIVSLENVNNEIATITITFIIISFIVLIIGGIFTLVISKGIIAPIKELTVATEKMAKGDLKVRSKVSGNDEITKLAKTFNYMAEELANRDKLKDEFISSVSHELRTPLTAIRGWVITIHDDITDKETLKTGLTIIEKESERLGNMVEELLDFSRLQNGKAVLNRVNINIYELIEYLEIYLNQRAERENKELAVLCDIDEDVYIDVNKMKQVIINLIDNAFKFTNEDGCIVLNITKEKDNLIIIVQDNGCGISQEDLSKVKQKFYKGKNAKSQNGIGLAICDEIVRMHGGDIEIESELNVGTKIIVKIPMKYKENKNEKN
ncbi:MAG: ATP-binding protein [Clostridium sp.]|nr:ATP-binding protein [Clostridium sp.]